MQLLPKSSRDTRTLQRSGAWLQWIPHQLAMIGDGKMFQGGESRAGNGGATSKHCWHISRHRHACILLTATGNCLQCMAGHSPVTGILCLVAYSSTAALEEHQAPREPPRGFCQPPCCSLECCQELLVLCPSPPSAKTSSLCEPCSLQASPSDVCSPPPPPAPTPYGRAARDHFSSTLPLLFLPGQACF